MTGISSDDAALAARAAELTPSLVDRLVRLARIPSVAAPGFPAEPLLDAHRALVEELRAVGVGQIDQVLLDGMTAPTVVADVPGPPGAPTVLVYTHYDVVPAGDEGLWDTPPFEPVVSADRVVGRGVADSKGNIAAILGALQLVDGRPPVTLRIVLEGHEEFGSVYEEHPPAHPELYAADAIVIADVGNVRPGVPTLTIGLRGSVTMTVEARTLDTDKHSGQFGGAAPDARTALIRALASLHDARGDLAVAGLRREPWTGASYTDDEFRELAGVLPGVPLVGTGDLGSRIWSGAAVTVIAFDAPPASAPLNAVASSARAVLNLRVHPAQPAREAGEALAAHLRAQRPFGIDLDVTVGEAGDGFLAPTGGPAFRAAQTALRTAWDGAEVGTLALGGSIPIVMAFHEAQPGAEKLLFGATDGYANIHGPNERQLLDELTRTVVALAVFWRELAAGPTGPGTAGPGTTDPGTTDPGATDPGADR
ncbi:M20/M25/M40 family metallo-hydrolase [Cellulomonas alba]|uniref:M20/M25/M40 family metallo-hydrolase n=1 Tax=Cellulomonas alba TaxID=3053467 RepID=A0ABT7SD90_9CELL|nr:M20/M25/M40 family metallo-hydrolase [Cellulomonas alba]MDM7854154.1 M20/M25/M40 family metallo-hydrolase [Cellulomonas alba]